jgi:NitT/TauT family transport system permease protein
MFLNTVVALRSVPLDLRDLMVSMRASRWQTFIHLEIPAGLPVILGGLKVSATLAVIGSVVGEFINADAGLGFLIEQARNTYDTPLVIVTVLTLALSARLLYGFVEYLEGRLLWWRRREVRE